jgi:hypothetical protein
MVMDGQNKAGCEGLQNGSEIGLKILFIFTVY